MTFGLLKILACFLAGAVIIAYAVCGYGLWAFISDAWPVDDPRMLMTGSGFIALYPGIGIALFVLLFRKRMNKQEYWAFVTFAVLGVALFPAALGITAVLKS